MGGKRRRDAAAAAAAALLAESRLHCDEADSHFKTGNFNKALRSYNKQVSLWDRWAALLTSCRGNGKGGKGIAVLTIWTCRLTSPACLLSHPPLDFGRRVVYGLEPPDARNVSTSRTPSPATAKIRGVKWTGGVRASRWATRGRGAAAASGAAAAAAAAAAQAARISTPDAQLLEEQRMAEARQAQLSHHAQEILKITRDTEFLHSFLRVDDGSGESDSEQGELSSPPRGPQGRRSAEAAARAGQRAAEERGCGDAADAETAPMRGPAPGPTARSQKTTFQQIVGESLALGALSDTVGPGGRRGRRARRRTIRGEEVYTDKDRAAAVQMGHRDIKQSLKMKQHQERVRALQLPEEAEPATLLALGLHELRQRRLHIAMSFINKALQLNPDDRSALVARSRCYLLLGQPDRALEDAETALRQDKNFIRGMFQKAEALYHLGDFEHSLMFYHRGLRLRPEMTMFRLGVQKAQEAIENTIGREHLLTTITRSAAQTSAAQTSAAQTLPDAVGGALASSTTARTDSASPKPAKRNQGSLAVDREYLEQLLKHPDLRVAHRECRTAVVSSQAEACVEYLRNRQEFWRQQKLADASGGCPSARTPR